MPLDVIPLYLNDALDIENTHIEDDWSSGCCTWWSEIPSVERPVKFGRPRQGSCAERIDINQPSGTIIKVQSYFLKLLLQRNKFLQASFINFKPTIFHHASPKRNSQPSRRPRSAAILLKHHKIKSNCLKATMMLPLRSILTPIPPLTQPIST